MSNREDQIIASLMRIEGQIGGIVSRQENQQKYLDAVSAKAGIARDRADAVAREADVALDAHKDDIGAHGRAAVGKTVGLMVGVATVIGAIYKGLTALGFHRS